MAEGILRHRLASLAGMRDVFLDDAEYRVARCEVIKTYAAAAHSSAAASNPTWGELDSAAAAATTTTAGSSDTPDGTAAPLLANLSAAVKRELGDALLSRFADGGAAFQEKVARLADEALAGAGAASADAPTPSLDQVVADVTAFVKDDLPDRAKASFVSTLSALLNTSLSKLKPAKRRAPKGQQQQGQGGDAAELGAQYSPEAVARYYSSIAMMQQQQQQQQATAEEAIRDAAALVEERRAEEAGSAKPDPQHRSGKKQQQQQQRLKRGREGEEVVVAAEGQPPPPPPPPGRPPPPPAPRPPPPPPPQKKQRVEAAPQTPLVCSVCATVQEGFDEPSCELCGAELFTESDG